MSTSADRHRPVAARRVAVNHGHFVVALVFAARKSLEDLAHPHHAEISELGRAQCAHAGSAVDVHALAHRPQDLLVPDGGDALEIAVDDRDHARPGLAGAEDVALRGRGQNHGLGQQTPHHRRVERGADEK